MFSGVVTGDIRSLIETTNRLSQVTNRQQSEDSIHKQLAAFERLLQHAMSRFSNDNLYHLLCHVTHWAETRDSHAQSKQATKVTFKLKSINQLRDIFGLMKAEIKGSQTNANEKQLTKTFDLFLNDLLYLRDLKKYFDDEIYRSLMKYHFDSSVTDRDSPQSPVRHVDKQETKLERAEDVDSGNGSQVDTDDTRTPRRNPETFSRSTPKGNGKDNATEAKYKYTVAELKSLLGKWEGLMTRDVLDLNHFDPDSYHELMQFNNYSQFEPILRLVPDLFAKCYKCIDLAKTWLKLANIVLKDHALPIDVLPVEEEVEVDDNEMLRYEDRQNFKYVPGDSNQTEEDFWKQVKVIQTQIENVTQSISDDEEQLRRYNMEMDDLTGRDEHFSTVTSQFEKMDSLVTIASSEYQKSKTEQCEVANKMRACKKHTPSYEDLKSNLKRLDTEVAHNHWNVKGLEFERTMVQEDYLVEMELRPSFIRFIGDTKEKIQDLERLLHVKREEKLKLEKHLALMKTNTERVRKIMRSYLGSASSSGSARTKTISRESSLTSTISEAESRPDTNRNLVDGNEADDDSCGPFDEKSTLVRPAAKQRHCKSGIVLQKPKILKKDVGPMSDRAVIDYDKPVPNTGRVTRVGPRPALKTTPRRVWENV